MRVFVGSRNARAQITETATGVISESFSPLLMAGQAAPTSQTVYGILLGARAGDLFTGVELRVSTAAVGTVPTTARFGAADATGKILALSDNLNAAASWAAGPQKFPFSASPGPYSITADGGYFACFVVNGAWAGTNVTLGRSTAAQAGTMAASSGAVPPSFTWASQADLPALGSSLTITSTVTNGSLYYMAFY